MKLLMVYLLIAFAECYSLPLGNLEFSKGTIDSFPDSGKTAAHLEYKSQESLPIKLDDAYGNAQNLVANIFHPLPLVDTIKEGDKYGNTGEPFRSLSEKIVGGVEIGSNFLNNAFEIPYMAFKKLTKSVTDSLNVVGGKLVGLN